MNYLLFSYIIPLLTFLSCHSIPADSFKAYYTNSAPIIDGNAADKIWREIPEWYDQFYIWKKNASNNPGPDDFSWRYKLAWDEHRFYVLVEITDEQLSDMHTDPRTNYWEDDCFEVMFDEDNSGGDHKESYQAFIYHISLYYDAVDIDDEGNVVLLNDHIQVKMDTVNGKYVWEAAFSIYDKSFSQSIKNTPVMLYEGKTMGWAMAYCDNDGNKMRDHFFGTNKIEGVDKNTTWKSADNFGEVILLKIPQTR